MSEYKGPSSISDRTVGVVMRLLARQGKAMTIPQIMLIVPKSYNTIKLALERGGAILIPDSYPKAFTVPELYEPERIIGNARDTVIVPYTEVKPLVDRWNKNRAVMARGLAGIEITPDADPERLADQFTKAASTLASAAYDILLSKDYVDWFTKLGGDLDEGA